MGEGTTLGMEEGRKVVVVFPVSRGTASPLGGGQLMGPTIDDAMEWLAVPCIGPAAAPSENRSKSRGEPWKDGVTGVERCSMSGTSCRDGSSAG